MKKLPIKINKKPTQNTISKNKLTHKFSPDYYNPRERLLHDENALLSLNHLINYHYLMTHVSFKLRGLLTLTEDNLFLYTCYKTEELEYQTSQLYILSKINEILNQEAIPSHMKITQLEVYNDDFDTKMNCFM